MTWCRWKHSNPLSERGSKKKFCPYKRAAVGSGLLIHDYIGVSLEVVWQTVKEEIPLVRPALVDMLEKMEAEEDGR
jgi:uncharacterized protein with HEPN domain